MIKMSSAGRAILLLAKRHCTPSKVKSRALSGSGARGVDSHSMVVDANTESNVEGNPSSFSSIDNKISMHLLRKNFSRPGLGLKSSKNRDNLVLDFFNLSKSVLENRLKVEEFVASQTFKKLEEQVELNIDFIGNAQIVNLLASVIKMKVNPSTNLVKLLEHEVKFRLKLFNLNQVIKMLKFYNSTELTSEQKQLVDMLSYRVRAYTQSEATTVRELTAALQSMAAQQAPSSLIASVEESLLNLITNVSNEEEDIVSRFIPSIKPYDYESLCQLFMKLAENGRRPTPLLRAASIELTKLASSGEAPRPKPEIIISTLSSLVSLSYPNRALISNLISDLTKDIKFEEVDSNTICNLLRTIGSLRWRPDELLKKLYTFIMEYGATSKSIDHNVIIALLHVTAVTNYIPGFSLKNFYEQNVKEHTEPFINRNSRKWLNYVWTLVALNITDETHIRSVLGKQFYENISAPANSSSTSHSDMMKFLNLRAIAQIELQLDNLDCEHLLPLLKLELQRSNERQKLSAKINDALNGMVASSDEIKHTIKTPFGFLIDCVMLLDRNFKPKPLIELPLLDGFENLHSSVGPISNENEDKRCALIYVPYEDTIVNCNDEVVGHKRMISRILGNFGFHTIFLLETTVNREKTSADLTNKLKKIIESSLKLEDKT